MREIEITVKVNNSLEEIDNILKDICEENIVKYIYMYDIVEKEELTDGLHPNSVGHQKMLERVYSIVKDL